MAGGDSAGDRVRIDLLGRGVWLLVLLMPVHVVFIRIGVAIKPWMIPLVVALGALVALPRRWRSTLDRVHPLITVGLLATLVSALFAAIGAADRQTALSHAVGIGIVVAVVAVVVAGVPVPRLGLAVRLGALLMAGIVIVEALLLFSGAVDLDTLVWDNRVAGQAAQIGFPDLLLVNGVHVDSNFSAMYAVAWLFLLFALPDPMFGRRADGVVVGLLIVQVLLSGSRGGSLALLIGALVAVSSVLVTRRNPFRGVSIAGALITLTVGITVMAVVDQRDGFSHTGDLVATRAGQMPRELGRIASAIGIGLGLAEGEEDGDLPPVDPDNPSVQDRSRIWLRYLDRFKAEWVTGVGYGVTAAGYSYAHNAPLEAAAGGGLLGLAGWLLMWLGAAIVLTRSLRTSPAAVPVASAAASVLIASMLLTTNYEPVVGLVLGIAAVSGHGELSTTVNPVDATTMPPT